MVGTGALGDEAGDAMKVALWRAYADADKRWHTVAALGLRSIVAHAQHCGLDIDPVWCRTAADLLHADADVFAISSVTAAWPQAKAAAEQLVALGQFVVLGGSHITCLPESLPRGCVGVLGEGEQTFADLLRIWLDDGEPGEAAGTVSWAGDVLRKSPPRPRIDLATAEHLPLYMAVGPDHLQAVATRGCCYRCWFCSASRCWSGKVTRFRPEWVAEQVGAYFAATREPGQTVHVPKAQQPKQPGGVVTFQDLHFASDPEWVGRCVAAMKANGAPDKWHVAGCSYSAKLAKPELFAQLKSVGCEWLGIGIESASPRILKKLKPHVTMADNEALLQLGRDMQIKICASFIVGTPGETEDDLKATRDFIAKWTGPYFQQSGLFMFTPYPGTPCWDDLLAKGKVSPDMDFGLLTNGANPDRQRVFYCNPAMKLSTAVKWRQAISRASR